MFDLIIKKFTTSRITSVIILTFILSTAYFVTNHYTIRTPRFLPLSTMEMNIPFLPWTVIIYLSVYLLIFFAIFFIDKKNFKHTAISMIIITIIHNTIFLFFPTHYPRPDFPDNSAIAIKWLYNFLISMDTPLNCFPSQHVSMALFVSLSVWRDRKKIGLFFLFWAILIIISTLTLKQHYFLDILGGFCVAFGVYKFQTIKIKLLDLFSLKT